MAKRNRQKWNVDLKEKSQRLTVLLITTPIEIVNWLKRVKRKSCAVVVYTWESNHVFGHEDFLRKQFLLTTKQLRVSLKPGIESVAVQFANLNQFTFFTILRCPKLISKNRLICLDYLNLLLPKNRSKRLAQNHVCIYISNWFFSECIFVTLPAWWSGQGIMCKQLPLWDIKKEIIIFSRQICIEISSRFQQCDLYE